MIIPIARRNLIGESGYLEVVLYINGHGINDAVCCRDTATTGGGVLRRNFCGRPFGRIRVLLHSSPPWRASMHSRSEKQPAKPDRIKELTIVADTLHLG
jgi:hypothetical protein